MTPEQMDHKDSSIQNFGAKFDIGEPYDQPSNIHNEDRFGHHGFEHGGPPYYHLEEEDPLADPLAAAIRNIEIRCIEENR